MNSRTPRHVHQAILTNIQVDVKIPTDIAPGDYLLRAEVIALHVAGGLNGAQFYPSCYQITVAGSGSASPAGVSFPGAYKNTDPGILVDIHAKLSTYIDPGPTVYAGGVSKTPGNTKCTGQAASEGPGGKPATGVSYTHIAHRPLTKADGFNRPCTPPAPAAEPLRPLSAQLSRLLRLRRPDLHPLLLRLHWAAAEAARSRSMDSAVAATTMVALRVL